jgi:hypothetical protein
MCFGMPAAAKQGSTKQELLPTDAAAAAAAARDEAVQQQNEQRDAPPKASLARRIVQQVAWNTHYLTFAPIVIMSVLQDLHLLLAALLNTCLAVTMLLLGFGFMRGRFIKVGWRGVASCRVPVEWACQRCGQTPASCSIQQRPRRTHSR